MLQSLISGGGDRPICCSQPEGCVEFMAPEQAGGQEDPNASFLLPLQSSVLPAGPRLRELRSYRVNSQGKEVSLGEPLVCGDILFVNVGHSIQEMQLVICSKGFMLAQRSATSGQVAPTTELHMLWSPFTVVERCQVKALKQSEKWAVFKLTIFRQEGMDLNLYFVSSGDDAERQRSAWIAVISEALTSVTQSLIPEHELQVQPVRGQPRTSNRIMAGYLLYSDAPEKVTLCYCELHAPSKGMAELVFYPDEHCEEEMRTLSFSPNATASTRKGSHCTVFGLDSHRFCARNRPEKDLWLRAISNVLVKLMFDRREPTTRDLTLYRAAVFERVEALRSTHSEPSRSLDESSVAVAQLRPATATPTATIAAVMPLMDEEPRKSLPAVVGDVVEPPEPGDDKISGSTVEPRRLLPRIPGDALEPPEPGEESIAAFPDPCEEQEPRFI